MRYTNLSYINEITMGDKSMIEELILLFIEQVDEFKANFKQFMEEKDWDRLGKEAHKSKSSVATFGMSELATSMKELQLLTQKEEKTEEYPNYIAQFEEQCDAAVIELKEYLKQTT